MRSRALLALGCVAALALAAATGCRIRYDALDDEEGDDAAPAVDAPGGGGIDADLVPDATAGVTDASSTADGTATASARDCGAVLPDTIALYDFEGITGTIVDSAGAHDGTPSGDQLFQVAGPPGCGMALYFSPGNNGDEAINGPLENGDASESYVIVPDSPAWDLDVGSIDLWVRPSTCAPRTLLSRDAFGRMLPGHIRIGLDTDCGVSLRVQSDVDETLVTSPATTPDTWHHVGVNFDANSYEIWIDGALETTTASVGGIAGNDNPWSFGSSQGRSDEGTAHPLNTFLQDVAIDRVRISSVRRSFE